MVGINEGFRQGGIARGLQTGIGLQQNQQSLNQSQQRIGQQDRALDQTQQLRDLQMQQFGAQQAQIERGQAEQVAMQSLQTLQALKPQFEQAMLSATTPEGQTAITNQIRQASESVVSQLVAAGVPQAQAELQVQSILQAPTSRQAAVTSAEDAAAAALAGQSLLEDAARERAAAGQPISPRGQEALGVGQGEDSFANLRKKFDKPIGEITEARVAAQNFIASANDMQDLIEERGLEGFGLAGDTQSFLRRAQETFRGFGAAIDPDSDISTFEGASQAIDDEFSRLDETAALNDQVRAGLKALAFEAAGAIFGQTGRGLSDNDLRLVAQIVGQGASSKDSMLRQIENLKKRAVRNTNTKVTESARTLPKKLRDELDFDEIELQERVFSQPQESGFTEEKRKRLEELRRKRDAGELN